MAGICATQTANGSVAENRGVLLCLLAAVAHRARRDVRTKAGGHGKPAEAKKADGDRDNGAVNNCHRVRLVGVIAEVVPHRFGAVKNVKSDTARLHRVSARDIGNGSPPQLFVVTNGLSLWINGMSTGTSRYVQRCAVARLPAMSFSLVSLRFFLVGGGLAASTVLLSACTRERSVPVVQTVARGQSPFWSVEVRTDRLLFREQPSDSVAYPYAPPDVDAEGRMVYRAKRYGNDPLLTLIIERGECRDSTSQDRYPGSALLTRGDMTWRGCATVVPDTATRAEF